MLSSGTACEPSCRLRALREKDPNQREELLRTVLPVLLTENVLHTPSIMKGDDSLCSEHDVTLQVSVGQGHALHLPWGLLLEESTWR